nr:LOW QUALITY PROTEIN: myosin-9-like [Cherax quadricarinatus]
MGTLLEYLTRSSEGTTHLKKVQLEAVSSSVMASPGDITELDSQIELIKVRFSTSNGLEIHKMLSEMLSTTKDTSTFQASVDHLQAMLDGQREKVETLTSDLALKTRLNEELHNELSVSLERANKLDYQVQQLTQSLQELTTSKEETNHRLEKETALVKKLQEANDCISQQTCEYTTKISSLSSELQAQQDVLCQLRESVETKESELQIYKECLKQIQLTSSDDHAAPNEEKLSALFDVVRVKAELQRVKSEHNNLKEQLQDSEMAQKNLEDALSSTRLEVSELRTHHDLAVQEKQEAMSKLAVLSQYFEEKEAQLTKELESQEGLRLNAEGSVATVSKKIQNCGLELATYKAQVESPRKEKKTGRIQQGTIPAMKKGSENWGEGKNIKHDHASKQEVYHLHINTDSKAYLQARAAERKLEEQRQENSQLRNRLTLLQKEKEEAQQLQVNIIKPTLHMPHMLPLPCFTCLQHASQCFNAFNASHVHMLTCLTCLHMLHMFTASHASTLPHKLSHFMCSHAHMFTCFTCHTADCSHAHMPHMFNAHMLTCFTCFTAH